ncbi:inositol polyphosphate multikinase [Plodia interpunctella]|uniref:inositol polyphosphate multikinase n=1 Tax=Plodia interpunctella TaxID=58824 RepID=UPI0023674CD6|nr:inositol polyphosphate multikinase [Plodia interpunctella]XP_053610799.1 inositol polyphosphate multikinase [Plodia interpunctella]XP_053610800.1 inositol polyphosphate multikinase [Plodia interpunctella]
MSDVKRPTVRWQRSIQSVHYDLPRPSVEVTRPLRMPHEREIQAYDRQVAGHTATSGKKYLGLLQCNDGTILKPIIKEAQRREMEFYERITTATEPDLIELSRLVPRYVGNRQYTYNGHQQQYIVLEDLTQNMLEPCIMDVKIGRCTWDPLATEEKIKNEQIKYAACKQQYAFCIPGFQVYQLATGQLHKYGKDYGKKLQGDMVIDAIKKFLNVSEGAVARALLLRLLAALWRAQRWARAQRSLALRGASLLLLYDAARLRRCCASEPPAARRRSIHSTHSPASGSNFSGQISNKGPVYKKLNPVSITPMSVAQTSFSPPPPINSPWNDILEKLNHNHSFDHNYEDKLSKIKMNFRATLDQMCSDSPNPNPWGTVKIIDFAHAFFNEDDDLRTDDNFCEGIDNLVKIFESFLRETNDQIM